jgi:shikimate kinase/3-dehydroquinate synthase
VIVLVGFMGSGKSSVGRSLAALLGTPFADTDEMVEERAGEPIGSIFERSGEAAFRDLERLVVADALTGPAGVVALGGGAVEDTATRAGLASDDVSVVYLDVPLATALERVGDGAARPMLARGDPQTLYAARAELYEAVADCTVAGEVKPPRELAGEIADSLGLGPRRIRVAAAAHDYEVIVGRHLLSRLAVFVPADADPESVFVVTHPSLVNLAGTAVESLASTGARVELLTVPEGESAKSLEGAVDLYSRLAESAAHRNDLVVGLGGGVVTDLAGFVASTYNRGMPIVHAPTTLLAQVDAAIGGKTGVNLSGAKNLVGTFHAPVAVVCDVDALASLPVAELRSGMAEVVKYGLIADRSLLEMITARAQDIVERDRDILMEVVARSAAIKAAAVAADEHEAGPRAHLNYGHTFGHAIEAAAGHEIRHGEAISIGMMAAAHLACVLGRIDEDAVAAHRNALSALGLPVSADLDLDLLERVWVRDKKYDRAVRFVLLAGVGHPEARVTAEREDIIEALKRLAS